MGRSIKEGNPPDLQLFCAEDGGISFTAATHVSLPIPLILPSSIRSAMSNTTPTVSYEIKELPPHPQIEAGQRYRTHLHYVALAATWASDLYFVVRLGLLVTAAQQTWQMWLMITVEWIFSRQYHLFKPRSVSDHIYRCLSTRPAPHCGSGPCLVPSPTATACTGISQPAQN
jgi:hypothetical protein